MAQDRDQGRALVDKVLNLNSWYGSILGVPCHYMYHILLSDDGPMRTEICSRKYNAIWIWTQNLLSTQNNCYPIGHDVQWIGHIQIHKRGRDRVVGIASSYVLDEEGVGVRVLVGSRIFSSPCRPDRLWGSPNLLYNGYRGFFLLG
jgi:hypothetical protein